MTYIYLVLDRSHGCAPSFNVSSPYPFLTRAERCGRITGPSHGRYVYCRPNRVDHWKRRLLEDAVAILDAEQECLRVAYEQVDDLRIETCGTS